MKFEKQHGGQHGGFETYCKPGFCKEASETERES